MKVRAVIVISVVNKVSGLYLKNTYLTAQAMKF